MKIAQISLALLIALSAFSLTASAQQPTPSPKPLTPQDAVTAPSSQPAGPTSSLKTLGPKDKFVSEAGRFSVNLPKDEAEIETKFDKDDGETGGEMFTWSLEEGVLVIHYVDMTEFDPKTEEDYAGVATGARLGLDTDSKILSERTITLNGNRGHEIVFESSIGKNIMRIVPVKNRLYALMFLSYAEVPDSVSLLEKALDSITLTKTTVKKKSPRK